MIFKSTSKCFCLSVPGALRHQSISLELTSIPNNHWEQEETLSNLSPAEQLKQIDVSLTLTLALTLT